MPKFFTFTLSTLAAAALMLGTTPAQQTPAAAPPAPSTKATQHPPASQGQSKSKSATTLTTQKDKFSYALGMNLGTNFKRQSVPVDADLVARGIRDTLAGGKTLLTEDEARAVMMDVQNQFRKQQQEKAQQAGEANKKEGAAFLAANKTKPGVVTLPSGLQYKIIQAGTGPKPAATDTVSVNYRGTLINGTEFDSSYKRGQPATFTVNGVIKGWTEALQLMPTGSKWQLFIPADLAYGERGAGADITPNATLIFEVELMSIKPPEKAPDKPEEKK
ncbi:MAG TPA: FKBP-type peptidyl-prolyl cis-trans isomerase [Terriglobales bacterium]|nr:FKBP-type peptidyl-prolyl cis-trans isomerase [Terriglobales bacterium]